MFVTAQRSTDTKFWNELRTMLVGSEHDSRPLLIAPPASQADVYGDSTLGECVACHEKVWRPQHASILTVEPIVSCRPCFEKMKDELTAVRA